MKVKVAASAVDEGIQKKSIKTRLPRYRDWEYTANKVESCF